uniref:PDZ domain-containing protein n=1 Tax=Pelusios castaneus TaxID=367368 RepID=A0A8C8RGB9_9SAUR
MTGFSWPSLAELREFGLDGKEAPHAEGHELAMEVSVQLMKDAHGLGFSLAGGRASLQGDRPLTIKKIFVGERSGVELLQPGDELLQIQERRLQGLARLEAWNLIRDLPTGPVRLLVRRRGKP